MKGFLSKLLSAINAYPQLGIRRDEKTDQLGLSPEAANKRNELYKYVFGEMLQVVKDSAKSYKKVFEKVIKDANEAELETEELKERLQKFTDIIDIANTLLETEFLGRVFELFGEIASLADRYDDIDEPTEEQTLIKRILDENGGPQIGFQFFHDFNTVLSKFITHIKEYVDSLSEEDKLKDAKFVNGFTNLISRAMRTMP